VGTSESARRKWLGHLLSTDAADRSRAEAAVRDLYQSAGRPAPRYFCWFDSLGGATIAVMLLRAAREAHWASTVASLDRSASSREQLDRVRAALCAACGESTVDAVAAAMGPKSEQGPDGILAQILNARFTLHGGDVSALYSTATTPDVLAEAERAFWPVLGHGHRAGPFAESSFYQHYRFSQMAADEDASAAAPPPLLAAVWTLAASAGPWWPFANGAILCDRPSEIHTNDAGLLHRGDGPATVYRDGTCAYGWEGKPLPDAWVLHPEQIAPGAFRGLPPPFQRFKAFVEARVGTPRRATAKKVSVMLTADLPVDHVARLLALREHAGGRLPMFDRYAAGHHREAWSELETLGPDVRQDPHAADALAVAYETMRRVAQNVARVAERLHALDYRFTTPGSGRPSPAASTSSRHAPRVPPGAKVRRQIRRLEKRVGAIPLSIRAFYEVVGAVDFNGVHPSLAPIDGPIPPDPLLVYGPDDVLADLESWDDEEPPPEIVIAPDDLHKADTSGGASYAMSVPDARVDGVLLNERHHLLFVDYLRLCFAWGGFPGYEGQDRDVPPEIERLRTGLLSF
jgi:Domain of unknown function (DUF6745)